MCYPVAEPSHLCFYHAAQAGPYVLGGNALPVYRVPEQCPQGVADLWRACTALDPSARPSACEALMTLQQESRQGSLLGTAYDSM